MISLTRSILRGAVTGASAVISFVLVRTLIRSFRDMWEGLGGIVAATMVMMSITIVYTFKEESGGLDWIYVAICLVLMHLFMWGIGFYKPK